MFFVVKKWHVVSHGYFFHTTSRKDPWGTIVLVLRFFIAKKLKFFWISLTGKGTSEVTSWISDDHLLVTSATKKMSSLLNRVMSGTLEKISSSLVTSETKEIQLGGFSCCFLFCPVALILSFSCGGWGWSVFLRHAVILFRCSLLQKCPVEKCAASSSVLLLWY